MLTPKVRRMLYVYAIEQPENINSNSNIILTIIKNKTTSKLERRIKKKEKKKKRDN